jgi:hypothetical protein
VKYLICKEWLTICEENKGWKGPGSRALWRGYGLEDLTNACIHFTWAVLVSAKEMMKRICVAIGAVLMLAMGVIVRTNGGEAGKGKPEAALSFLGITNNGTGEVAMFCFTNPTPAHFVFAPPKIEKLESNAWTEVKVKNPFARAERNRWAGMKEELHGGEGFTFMGAAPVTNVPWRLTFACIERSVIKDGARDLASQVTGTNSVERNTRTFSGRQFTVTSPEVKPGGGAGAGPKVEGPK